LRRLAIEGRAAALPPQYIIIIKAAVR